MACIDCGTNKCICKEAQEYEICHNCKYHRKMNTGEKLACIVKNTIILVDSTDSCNLWEEDIGCNSCKFDSGDGYCTENSHDNCSERNEYKLWEPKPEGSTAPRVTNPFKKPQVAGSHYRKNNTMDVAEWCERRKHSPCEFNVIKYTDRHKQKNGIEDLRKAKQYLEFLAWVEYKQEL